MTETPFDIIPFDAPLGAEIRGLDASRPLSPATHGALMTAWRKHLVLVFHGQTMSDDALLAFSRHFGDLDPPAANPYGETFLPDYPELNVISNVVRDGKPIGNLGDGEAVWHADMTYIDNPSKAAVP